MCGRGGGLRLEECRRNLRRREGAGTCNFSVEYFGLVQRSKERPVGGFIVRDGSPTRDRLKLGPVRIQDNIVTGD